MLGAKDDVIARAENLLICKGRSKALIAYPYRMPTWKCPKGHRLF